MSHYTLFARDEDGERPNAHEVESWHDSIQHMMQDVEYWEQVPHETRMAMLIVRDVCCWMLGHDHNPSLPDNLEMWANAYRAFRGTDESFNN